MPTRQQTKGRNWERLVASQLSEIFGLSFHRTFGSGAYTGGKNVLRVDTLSKEQNLFVCGDIVVPIELQNIVIECKSYKDFSFSSLFTSNAQLDDWIEQVTTIPKIWFIIFKITHKGMFIVFDKKYQSNFKKKNSWMIYKNSNIICSFDDFFKENKDVLLTLTPK